MIAIIDYGAGNLFSIQNALNYLGVESIITAIPEVIRSSERLILPGVGAFPDAMQKLLTLAEIIKAEVANGKSLLGICLGMQLLFERGYEFKECEGLGLISGSVELIVGRKILPHMGFNQICYTDKLGNINSGSVYFVHSYMAVCNTENVVAYADYEGQIPAMVRNIDGNVLGCLFHPEKSGEFGLGIISNWIKGLI